MPRVCLRKVPEAVSFVRVKSEVPPPRQVPNPVTQLISCPHSPLLMPSASFPSFSIMVQFQFARLSQGCRSVHLRICFSKNILPFIFILYIGVWESLLKKRTCWKTRCLGHFCSVHVCKGGPGGFVSGGCTSCCRVHVEMSEIGPGPCACPVALALLGIGVLLVCFLFWGGTSLFLFHFSLWRNTICGLMSKFQVICTLSYNALSQTRKLNRVECA